ncbi:MAG TPA: glycosyltransferase [Thermoanaerobaculia bacterium]|nr:glycosyltransferase [Thermoanaerobaculia bacterium]
MSAPDGVDVVVPVYGAAADLSRCLASVLAHSELGRHRLVVVLDGPQQAAVEGALAPVASRTENEVVVLRQPQRRGFASAANRGLAASERDTVLLNSDTQVTAGWLDKLQRAAASTPDAGTVTPFSNHATICSLPRFLEENNVPAGYDVDSFGALVERVAAPSYPRLPTGVGFCMLVRRRLLDEVGTFDEGRFGLGYGEEVDLCLRAAAAGFVHLLADDTYVWHRGHGSFGGARSARMRGAERRMRTLHPGYTRTIADFMRRDPLAEVRERVLAALAPARTDDEDGEKTWQAAPSALSSQERAVRDSRVSGGIVHLVHGWPPFATAGTEVYAQGLARRQARHHRVAAFARVARSDRQTGDVVEHFDHGVRVRLLVNNFDQRDPLARNALDERRQRRVFAHFLDEERPALLHVHHLAGHVATLVRVAARRGIPVVMQLQDWWPLCARVNLLHRDGYLCPGPGIGRCAACAPLTRRPPAAVWNRLLHALRRRWMRQALAAADVLVAGSRFLADSYARLGWVPGGREIRVIPYGIEANGLVAVADARVDVSPVKPLRCGFIGSLMAHKGAHVAVAAFASIAASDATLDLWGDPTADLDYTQRLHALAGPAVRFRGRFPEGGEVEVMRGLDLLLVPSLGLESFGLVAREAHAAGVPVLASRRGALAELFAADAAPRDGAAVHDAAVDGERGGALVEPDDPQAIAHWVRRLVAEPELLAAWRRTPAPKSMDEHAEEIEALYAEVLAARRGGRRALRGRR